MSDDTGRRILIVTFLTAIAFLTWQEVKNKTVPRPQRYVGAGVIWAVLGLTGPVITYPVAATFSIGMLLMLFYQTLSAGSGGAAVGSATGSAIAGSGGAAVGSATGAGIQAAQ